MLNRLLPLAFNPQNYQPREEPEPLTPHFASVSRSFVQPQMRRNMLSAVLSNRAAGRVEQSNAFGMANDPGYGNAGNGNAMSGLGGNTAQGGAEARGGNARAGGGGGGNGAQAASGGRTQGPAGMPLGDAILAQYQSAYGPARPDPAGDDIVTAVRRAAAEVFGPEAKVVGTSGTGEHGSQRHRLSAAQRIDSDRQSGFALDFHIVLPDGSKLETTSPQARDFVIAAARNGVSGFGAGARQGDYMGAHGFHMDMFPIDAYSSGMGRTWATMGGQYGQDFVNAYQPFGG